MNSQFPFDWQLIPLEDCLSALIDYRGKTAEKVASGVPLLSAKVINSGHVDWHNLEYIAEENYYAWMRRGFPQPGDVVFTTEAPLGEVAQLDTRRVALGQRIVVLRGNPDLIDNMFLKHQLMSDFVQLEIRGKATGTTAEGIKQTVLRRIPIPVPPLLEQRKITAILSTWDEAITFTERLVEALRQRKQALMQLLLTGAVRFKEFEGTEWCKSQFLDFLELHRGFDLPTSERKVL